MNMSDERIAAALVLIAGNATIDADAIVDSYRRVMPGAAELIVEPNESAVVLSLAGTDLEVVVAPHDGDWQEEIEAGVDLSVSSFEGSWRLPPHTARLAVAYAGDSALRLDFALTIFTTIVAAVAGTVDTVGVYWPASGAIHEPRFFREIASQASMRPPVTLWTGVQVMRSDDQVGLLSSGLPEQLDLPDLLLAAPAMQTDRALALFFQLIESMVRDGRAPAEDETVGRTADERLPVAYVTSPVSPERVVLLVELS
jgi:hypothetical protein